MNGRDSLSQVSSHGPLRESIAERSWNLQIGARFANAEGGRTFMVESPSDASVLAVVADASVADGLKALDAACVASKGWAQTPPRERSNILMRCFHLLNERSDWFARLISLENGKTLADARNEVVYAAEFFRWYAEECVRILGELGYAPSGTNRILVQYQPIGVALLVTPWNFPAAMATRKIAPALAAGCTCVLKPAAETPLTALALGELMLEAGVPPGVVNIITTTNADEVVGELMSDNRVRKLSFTGSTQVGRVLLRAAADKVISCSMELGGNAPFIVFDDADLGEAIPQAMIAKMRNGGAACTAANRFIVQRGVYKEFVSQLGVAISSLKVGCGSSNGVQCGSLINGSAVAKVRRLVDDAVAKGARIVAAGEVPNSDGYYYPPSVLADVPPHSAIFSEEIFGPVAAVMSFDTEEDALRLANETEYGLIAYIFSSDMKKALRVSEQIESGMVAINRGMASDPAAPFGGMKQSGLGREGGKHGLMEFLEPQYISIAW